MTEAWRYAYASVAGTSHEKTGAACQDAGACRLVEAAGGGSVLLAMASDGAGSVRRSGEGAALAIELFFAVFGAAVRERGMAAIDRALVLAWLRRLRRRIAARAVKAGIGSTEFACTALGAVVAEDCALFFQIGDGAIVMAPRHEQGAYRWVFWPQHGEFANTTNFVTQRHASRAVEVTIHDGPVDEIAIFTDGIERLVLDLSAKTAHAPFFRPLFHWLAGTSPATTSEPSPSILQYLGSKQVCDRTDDDKTLILATRRAAAAASHVAAAVKSAAAL